MKYVLTLICMSINLSAIAQLQKPTWEMPIYFLNGDFSRDTVYLGVDSLATVNFDSLFEDDSISKPWLSKNFGAYFIGDTSWGKRSVQSPVAEGFSFTIFLFNVDQGLEITVDLQDLADTTHGVKNVVWDEQSQSYIADVYKGAQMWVYYTRWDANLTSQCGAHGGDILAFAGGSPRLPAMKEYPVCYVHNTMSISALFRGPGEKFDLMLDCEIKPMNILGSPLIGIEEMQDLDVSLYPNPVTGEFHIDNQESEPLQVVIYNYLAKEVKRLELSPFEFLQTDLAFLPAGMYVVELATSKSRTYKKVLKH